MGFKRILVALDRSMQAPLVFEQALEQAKVYGGCLMLVHTVRAESDIPSGAFMGLGTIADIDTYSTLKRIRQEQLHKEIQHAQEWLQDSYQHAITEGIATETDCRSGDPAVWICKLAQDWQADLIVLGRRGHQGIKEVVLGSVSNYVLHHAPCSVLVVQGAAPPKNGSV